jgi:hypothetical protein
MNFREGMRRIGLTVGVIGGLAGAYAAVLILADIAPQRRAQSEFDSLLKVQLIQEIARDLAKEKIVNISLEIPSRPKGIRLFRVNGRSEIEAFELEDGRTVMRTNAPSALWYLLYPLLAAAGFLLPWGAVRLVNWIVSGFIGSSPPQKTC